MASAALHTIDDLLPLTIEIGGSDVAIAETFNEKDHSIAFHSKTLSPAEQRILQWKKIVCCSGGIKKIETFSNLTSAFTRDRLKNCFI